MTETLASGYSSESARRELFNEYQQSWVSVVFKDFLIFLLWTKVASALEGLKINFWTSKHFVWEETQGVPVCQSRSKAAEEDSHAYLRGPCLDPYAADG